MGLKYSRLGLIEKLAEHDDVSVFCENADKLQLKSLKISKTNVNLRPNTAGFYLSAISARRSCLEARKDDTIIFNLIVVLGLSILRAFPQGKIIIVVTGLGFVSNAIFRYLLKKMLKSHSPLNLRFIVQNQLDLNVMKALFPEYEVSLIESSGVRLNLEYRATKGSKEEEVFCYLGRINFRKGFGWLLLFYFWNGSEKKLLIGGNASFLCLLILRVAKFLNRNICYVGYVDNVQDFLNSADTLIYPARYNDGFPRTILEAWATGTLVVARSTKLNNAFLKSNKFGVVTKIRDFNASNYNRDAILRSALERVEKLSMESVEAKYVRSVQEFFYE